MTSYTTFSTEHRVGRNLKNFQCETSDFLVKPTQLLIGTSEILDSCERTIMYICSCDGTNAQRNFLFPRTNDIRVWIYFMSIKDNCKGHILGISMSFKKRSVSCVFLQLSFQILLLCVPCQLRRVSGVSCRLAWPVRWRAFLVIRLY